MSWDIEFNKGENVVDACKSEGVQHLVWSALPNYRKMSAEFDSIEHTAVKAAVADYAEKVKGEMNTSYFMPAHYMTNTLAFTHVDAQTGRLTLTQPPSATETWIPLLNNKGDDTELYVAGLIEPGPSANGIYVQGTPEWLRPVDVVETLSQVAGREVVFKDGTTSVKIYPPPPGVEVPSRIPEEMRQTSLMTRTHNYFGKDSPEEQPESDKFLLKGAKRSSYKQFLEKARPFPWE